MVNPMDMQTPAMDPPEEAKSYLSAIKYCVIGVWLCVLGRVINTATGNQDLGSAGGVTGDIVLGFIGVFLCKDDPVLKPLYECLMRSLVGQCTQGCGGGMSCLPTFLLMAAVNIFFDSFSLMQILFDRQQYLSPFIGVSFILTALGACLANEVRKMVTPPAEDDVEGGGNYQAVDTPRANASQQQMAGREMTSAAPPAAAPAGRYLGGEWIPFRDPPAAPEPATATAAPSPSPSLQALQENRPLQHGVDLRVDRRFGPTGGF